VWIRVRNIERFPDRFRFVLSKSELNELITNCDKSRNKRHYPGTPTAFTEQGVAMLSAILRSPTAIEVSIRIMDAFKERGAPNETPAVHICRRGDGQAVPRGGQGVGDV